MFIEKLDRQQWTFTQAYHHILRLSQEQFERDKAKEPVDPNPQPYWSKTHDPALDVPRNALSELIVALKDGDILAKGRLSKDRCGWIGGGFALWEHHSGYHEPISPVQWRAGKLDLSNQLEFPEGQFIDIRIPRFMVLAIWPELPPEERPQASVSEAVYTTPYMDLMQAAIREFGITAARQDKKEAIVAWFLEHDVEGEPLSRNLADAMATLIRVPSAQRGGAKRMIGPDLRDVG